VGTGCQATGRPAGSRRHSPTTAATTLRQARPPATMAYWMVMAPVIARDDE
jgi:hypothetical protein